MGEKSRSSKQSTGGSKTAHRGGNASSKLNVSAKELTSVVTNTYNHYFSTLTPRLKLIDTFLVFLVLLGILQFGYVLLIGNFPFNAFLGGFIMCVGQFVLTVSLRLQVNNGTPKPGSKEGVKGEPESELDAENSGSEDSAAGDDKGLSRIGPQRAFGDFIFASLILHFVVYHFIN